MPGRCGAGASSARSPGDSAAPVAIASVASEGTAIVLMDDSPFEGDKRRKPKRVALCREASGLGRADQWGSRPALVAACLAARSRGDRHACRHRLRDIGAAWPVAVEL